MKNNANSMANAFAYGLVKRTHNPKYLNVLEYKYDQEIKDLP